MDRATLRMKSIYFSSVHSMRRICDVLSYEFLVHSELVLFSFVKPFSILMRNAFDERSFSAFIASIPESFRDDNALTIIKGAIASLFHSTARITVRALKHDIYELKKLAQNEAIVPEFERALGLLKDNLFQNLLQNYLQKVMGKRNKRLLCVPLRGISSYMAATLYAEGWHDATTSCHAIPNGEYHFGQFYHAANPYRIQIGVLDMDAETRVKENCRNDITPFKLPICCRFGINAFYSKKQGAWFVWRDRIYGHQRIGEISADVIISQLVEAIVKYDPLSHIFRDAYGGKVRVRGPVPEVNGSQLTVASAYNDNGLEVVIVPKGGYSE